MDDALCVCGHPRSEHYRYILNGRDQGRCRACDPLVGNRETHVALEQGTYVHAMYYAADHDFTQLDAARRQAEQG